MIQAFAANLFEAYRAPRASARRIMSMAPSMQDCLLIVVLAFAIQSMVAEGYALASGTERGVGRGLFTIAAELVVHIVVFFVMTSLVYLIGRRFGGTGTQDEVAAVVAWHTLVTAFLAPLQVIGLHSVDPETQEVGSGFILVPLAGALAIWIFASFVAEAHGFKRLGGVILFTIGGFAVLAMVATALMRLFGLVG